MKLWTQYQILVQFCLQGMSAWYSVALISVAVETWTVLWDVLSSLTQKASFFPQKQPSTLSHANTLLWYSERQAAAAPFSSKRPLLWKLLFPLSSPCHHSSLLARLSWARIKDEKAEGRDGCWRLAPRAYWLLSQRRAAALLQSSNLPEAAAVPYIPWAAILNRSRGKKEKGMYAGCSSIGLLSERCYDTHFLNLSWWEWLDIFGNI